MPEKKAFQRLPKDIVPSNYALKLQPNLTTFTFEGEETISVEVKTSTDKILLNSADIKVKTVEYTTAGGSAVTASNIEYAADDETVTFTFPAPLAAGPGSLAVSFSGELNDKMKGFYRSKYPGPEGEDRFCAVTQFEATDARRCFPCWDEPAVKATFDVTLVVPKDRVALSNMQVKSECEHEKESALKVMTFEKTPIMSTYLLAFIVGEYDYVEDTDSDGVVVRVYTPVGKKEQGQFALEVAVKTLPFYKNYFDIAYPLPKVDLIAIADFAAGAMENWGLITYRESALLIDPENSSSAARQYVALVVGHELAHQWFGNLVTMEWWTHLWLNEGFASWIEYLCVDHCFPDYDIWTQFATSDFTRALELDALASSHPIEVPVGHPSEVDEIFDAISYSKGASVIRMLHDYIGDEDFKKGMHNYLTKHKYTNTFTEDLWDALGKASGKPIEKIMETWTKKMGYPVIQMIEKKNGTSREVTVRQEKFCADGKMEGESPVWMVPLSFCSKSSPDKAIHRFVLEGREATVTIKDVPEGDWLKLNVGGVGFYRTNYTPESLEALQAAILDGSLPPRDRLGLQNDLFAMARAGVASTVEALKAASAFRTERNYTVWSDLISNLGQLGVVLQYSDCYEAYQGFVKSLVREAADSLGWDVRTGESHLDAMLRGLLLSSLGRNGCAVTAAEAQSRLAKHESKEAVLPADLRGAVYATVLRNGGEAELDQLLKLFHVVELQEERVRIMRSLGAVKQPELIQRVLEFGMSEHVRSQDTVFVLGGATGSVKGREATWKFVQEHWKALHNRYEGGFLLSRLVKFSTENFASEEHAQEVLKFFEANPAPAAERTIRQSLENIRLNEKQLKRDASGIQKYLSSCS